MDDPGQEYMSVDDLLWLGVGSNPGKMLSWAILGSSLVALVTTKILADTVKYYDYYGFSDKKLGICIALGTTACLTHLGILCAQSFKLAQYVYTDFASIIRFDIYACTASDLISGLFSTGAAIYYTDQVFRLSGRKIWILVLIITLNLGTFIMTIAVSATGFHAPQPNYDTLAEFGDYNLKRIPYYIAWGVLGFVGDLAIWAAMTYYLFKVKSSIMHRERRVWIKLQTLLIGTMFPPVIIVLILTAASGSKASPFGDFRRAARYFLPPFYYLSPLHSIVAKIDIRERLNEDRDNTEHGDSIPLSPAASQWPRGDRSTIHIDPNRGKADREEDITSPARTTSRGNLGSVGEQPAKGTFGLITSDTDTNTDFDSRPKHDLITPARTRVHLQDTTSTVARGQEKGKSNNAHYLHGPSKKTFGAVESNNDLELGLNANEGVLGPMRL